MLNVANREDVVPLATLIGGVLGTPTPAAGYRHGHRERRLCGSFGTVEIAVPRARIGGADGTGREWKSKVLPRYARMTRQVEALIAGTYLAGTNTRRVRRALAAISDDLAVLMVRWLEMDKNQRKRSLRRSRRAGRARLDEVKVEGKAVLSGMWLELP